MSTETLATPVMEITAASDTPVESRAPQRDKTLTQKAYLNGVASLLDSVVKGGVVTLVTPVIVRMLGPSVFGLYQILAKLVVYMHAADGRPTAALKWVIANRHAVDDDETKRRHVGSAVCVWLMFLPVLGIMSIVLVWISPHMTKVPVELYTTIRITCALMVINFLLMQLIEMPEAVLRGMNLGYKRMGLQASLNLLGGGFAVLALYLGGGLIGLAAADAFLSCITCVLFVAVVRKYVAWFGVSRPAFTEVKSFLKLSIWWFAWTTVQKFIMASDILILGLVASATAVTTYTLTGFAGDILLTFVSTVVGAMIPGMGTVVGKKQFERAAALRVEIMAGSWLLLAAVGSTILLWNRSFVYLWVGKQHYAGSLANLLIVLITGQLIFMRNDAYVIDLTLQIREKVIMGAAAAVISISLSAALIPSMGITGLCIGLLVGRLALTISYPLVIRKRFLISNRPGIMGVARPGLTMAVMFGASSYLGGILLADNWFLWIVCTGLSFCVALGIALLVGLRQDLRVSLISRLSKLRPLIAPQ